MDSILETIKTMDGIMEDYSYFNPNIVLCINTAFAILAQLGIGPEDPFVITGPDETWDEFEYEGSKEAIKSYIALRVQLLFDPPNNSFLVQSINDQIKELEFRLLVDAEIPKYPEYSMEGIYDQSDE